MTTVSEFVSLDKQLVSRLSMGSYGQLQNSEEVEDIHMSRVTAKSTVLILAKAVAALSALIPESWFGSEFTAAA